MLGATLSLTLGAGAAIYWPMALLPAAVLVVVGLAAVLPAARRAARTDPLVILRGE